MFMSRTMDFSFSAATTSAKVADAVPNSKRRTKPKTVYLIRHGVAQHNVPDLQTGERPNLFDPKFTDPPLIRQGELQARALGERMRREGYLTTDAHTGDVMDVDEKDTVDNTHATSHGSGGSPQAAPNPIELVVCSPLTRCLQTASHIFPSHFTSETQPFFAITVGSGSKTKTVNVLNRRCKMCCHGDIREAFGMHYPDKRSPLSRLKSMFPNVSYHPSLTEHDTDWRPDTRETRQDVSLRIHNFFTWLLHQPHDNVAVVTHGVWMECALLNYCPELEIGKKRVHNCDVYSGQLSPADTGSLADENNSSAERVRLNDVAQLLFYHV